MSKPLPGGRTIHKRSGPKFGRMVLALVVLCVAGFIGAFVAKRYADPQVPISTTITSMFNPIPSARAAFGKQRLAILVMGLDYNYDEHDQEFSTSARSDTIMAASLDLDANSLHVLSIPRDMRYQFADGTVDKINAAYSRGGPHAAERAVARFLGIPGFDRYITLRIDATKSLIDAIGGIDVPVTETMNYDDSWGHLHIHFHPGLYHMNGDQAVSYSRFRHDACSDPCRIKRQQQVLRITIAKLKNDKFNDIAHINKLIDVFNHNVETDLTNGEKLSLASSYAGFNVAALKTDQIPYVDDQVIGDIGDVLIPDDAAKAKLVRQYFLAPVGTPAPPPDPSALASIDPAQIHIQVENGSGTSGLGKSAADLLKSRGFNIDAVGNADSFDHAVTEIHVTSSVPYLGIRIRNELAMPAAEIDDDSASAGSSSTPVPDVTVIVGRDFAGRPHPAQTVGLIRE